MATEYSVVWTAQAADELGDIYDFILEQSGYEGRAWSFVTAIQDAADALSVFPKRGAQRDDLMPGLRIVPCAKRAVMAFLVDDALLTVRILGVFYGGRDYEAVLTKAPR